MCNKRVNIINMAYINVFLFCVFLFVFTKNVNSLNNGLARTPPMGWLSWQRFRCITDCKLYPDECISDRLFRKMANLMSSEGYLDAGYEYLIIDDCWLARERDAQGRLQPDPDRFPHGMKDLADYIHSKGLKFGIYENFGNFTCAGYPGIMGHLEIDAQTFADWEVDYIKIDGCYANRNDYEQGYVDFGRLLNKTGRPIVYSCSWPYYLEAAGIHANYSLLAKTCNLWRNWDDIQDSYSTLVSIIKWFSANQKRLAPFSAPGHWNDPDMLIIGNFGLSYVQSKSQMAIWAIMAAPMLMSVDFRTIKKPYKDILLHPGAIAVNQDKLGIQGLLVKKISGIDIWLKPITPVIKNLNSWAIAFHSNRDDGYDYAINVTLRDLRLANVSYVITDIFEPEKMSRKVVNIDEKLIVKVLPSGVVFWKLVPQAAVLDFPIE